MKLAGKTAFVTGAGSGIGRQCARAFAAAGARVMAADIVEEGLAGTLALIRADGGEAASVICDVSDAAAVAGAVRATIDRFGSLDCALNNAGISGPDGDVHLLSPMDAQRIMEVNFWGVFNGMMAQIAVMVPAGGGTIVNIASEAGLVAAPGYSLYAGSKAAVLGISRSVAMEYATRGIRINTICPGFVGTPMTDPQRVTEEARTAIDASSPLGRVGTPDEIAAAAIWLSSPEASFVLAVNLPVDGGHSAR